MSGRDIQLIIVLTLIAGGTLALVKKLKAAPATVAPELPDVGAF